MKIRKIEIFLFAFMFCIIATACEKGSKENSSEIVTDSSLTEITTTENFPEILPNEELTKSTDFSVETTIISSTTAATMTQEFTASMITTTNDEKIAEKQLVKEILLIDDPYYPEENAEEYAEKDAELMVNSAEPFSEISLGSIASEEDAKEKGRSIFIEWLGQKFVDDLESDFVIRDEKPIKFERDDPPYSVTYYEKYDAWIIKTDLPSGKTEDGGWIATPGSPRYVILRGSDGKVLAVY